MAGHRQVAELDLCRHGDYADTALRLFVTPRAVEWHLTHTYRKLGIRSRAGLAAALSRLDDEAPAPVQA